MTLIKKRVRAGAWWCRDGAQGVAEPDQLVKMWTVGGVVPWASEVRNVFIQITPRKITGRVVAARAR